MNDSGKFILAALSGVAIGLAIGVLVAPASGDETMTKIKTKFDGASEDLADMVNRGKDKANEVVEQAKGALNKTRGTVEEQARESMNKANNKATV